MSRVVSTRRLPTALEIEENVQGMSHSKLPDFEPGGTMETDKEIYKLSLRLGMSLRLLQQENELYGWQILDDAGQEFLAVAGFGTEEDALRDGLRAIEDDGHYHFSSAVHLWRYKKGDIFAWPLRVDHLKSGEVQIFIADYISHEWISGGIYPSYREAFAEVGSVLDTPAPGQRTRAHGVEEDELSVLADMADELKEAHQRGNETWPAMRDEFRKALDDYANPKFSYSPIAHTLIAEIMETAKDALQDKDD